ncbi:MAG TPA: ABC transporter substrate-binding protein, partial [Opitutaceae bacterium]|nr:ABC transporter substrate-binding protein [Opitutaceae bacterium]
MQSFIKHILPALAAILLLGCGKKTSTPSPESGPKKTLTKIFLQTDWYAEAEHGGYYQALAKGFYTNAGLDVEILQGGPNAVTIQKIATGKAQFGLENGDTVLIAESRGIPVTIVAGLMQHDPQAVMLHEENPINSFKELDGKTVMAVPGSAWIEFVKQAYGINFNIIPDNFGLEQFAADKNFIQQAFITNEPYYLKKLGFKTKLWLIADSGYDPYRVVFTSAEFAKNNPEIVKAFIAASIRGWNDYLENDPTPANQAISAINPKMTPEYMAFSISSLRENKIIKGNPAKNETIGQLKRERIEAQLKILSNLKM